MIEHKHLVLLVLVLLSACGVSGEPGRTVEDYFTAIAAGDDIRAVNLSCSDWEVRARMDADSFLNVQTTIEALSCAAISQTETRVEVQCSGRIMADYQGENLIIDLSLQTYQLIAEDGVWRVCGNP